MNKRDFDALVASIKIGGGDPTRPDGARPGHPRAARALLRVAARNPEAVAAALRP